MDNNRVSNSLYFLEYMSTNIFREKSIKAMHVHGLVKTCKPKPNHHFSNGTKEKDECHKKHSLIESGWTNQQDMGKVKDNIALSLFETQARMIIRSKMQPASY
jgi:hypothetical protein